ncbi:MAG: carbonic anhydrase [Candidatus Omnitrophota bacterium]
MKFKFATAINCIDGRVQAPVSEFIKNNYNTDYVDMITIPGPDKVLSEYEDTHEIESIKKKVLISRNNHNSKLLFIAGHYDCASNPCTEEVHLQQVRKAVKNLGGWGLNSEIYGIWVDKELKASLVEQADEQGGIFRQGWDDKRRHRRSLSAGQAYFYFPRD